MSELWDKGGCAVSEHGELVDGRAGVGAAEIVLVRCGRARPI